MFCKFSLLTFYVRIFVIRTFRFLAYFVAAVVCGWALSVILETFLLCRPFAYNWDPTIKDFTCGNRNAAYLGAGSLNIITDLMVLCLPIPMVWNLQIPRRNKVILSAVFGMGLLYVPVKSVCRALIRTDCNSVSALSLSCASSPSSQYRTPISHGPSPILCSGRCSNLASVSHAHASL